MSVSVEIWRSVSGTADSDFSLIATVADSAPYTKLDSPVISGQLYIYKARRYDSRSGLYSGFSNLVFLVGMYPTEGLTMNNLYANVNPNIVTKLGIGMEPTSAPPGQAVKAGRLLLPTSFDPGKGGMKRIERNDIQGFPGVIGLVNGEAAFPLKAKVAGTPEGIDELLCLYFGAPTTEAVSGLLPAAPAAPVITNGGTPGSTTYAYTVVARGPQGDSSASSGGSTTTGNASLSGTNYNTVTWLPVAGAVSYVVLRGGNIIGITQGLTLNDVGTNQGSYSAPSAPTGNMQTWTNTFAFRTATLSAFFGNGPAGSSQPMVRFYGGCAGDKMTLKFEKKSSTPFELDMDLLALYEIDGFSMSAVGLDVATADTLDPYAEAFGVVKIGGALADCEEMTCSVDCALGTKTALTGYAGPIAFYKQGSKHKITAKLYFSSDAERQRYFGQVNQAGFYSQINKVLTFPVEIILASPVNGAGIVNQIGILATRAAYNMVGEPISGRDGCVMQDVEITPLLDTATGTDLTVTNVNSRTNGNIINAGTLITGIPANGLNPYSN